MRIVLKGNGRRIVLRQTGARGQTGPVGPQGPPGQDGEGLPTGGTAGQVPVKQSSTDFDIAWETPPAAPVTSVNGQTGAVVLDAGDVGADAAGSAMQALADANQYTDTAVAGVDTGVMTIVAGDNVTVDSTDPANPVVSADDAPATTWGSITGTLSDQTDLQNALDAKYDATNPAGYISGVAWGDITGTLSDQTDLQSALDDKADVSDLADYLPLSGGTLSGSLSINGDISVNSTSANPFIVQTTPPSFFADFVFRNLRPAATNNQMNIYTQVKNDAGTDIRALQITTRLPVITAGSETSQVVISTYSGGSQQTKVIITSTNFSVFSNLHMQSNTISNLADGTVSHHAVNLSQLDARFSQAQRTAVNALVPATATPEDIVNALQA